MHYITTERQPDLDGTPTDWKDLFDKDYAGVQGDSKHNFIEHITSERYAILTLQPAVN